MRSGDTPEHARLFESLADDGFTASFDYARADENLRLQQFQIIYKYPALLKTLTT